MKTIPFFFFFHEKEGETFLSLVCVFVQLFVHVEC